MNVLECNIFNYNFFHRLGRNGLNQSRIQYTGSSLGILSAYKRRQRAAALVHDLSIISTLVSSKHTTCDFQHTLHIKNEVSKYYDLINCLF